MCISLVFNAIHIVKVKENAGLFVYFNRSVSIIYIV